MNRKIPSIYVLAFYVAVWMCWPQGAMAITVTDVLGFASMNTIKHTLENGYPKRGFLFPYHNRISGIDIVEEILEGYNPEEALINTEARLSSIFDQYNLDERDRIFLANVAHLIWVELHRTPSEEIVISPLSPTMPHPIPGPPPPLGQLTLKRVDPAWSLKDLTVEQVDNYLIGSVNKEAWKHIKHYSFRFYPKARDVLHRMQPYHPHVAHNHLSAISRLVEYTGDNFIHTYSDSDQVPWDENRYLSGSFKPYSVINEDKLSEGFQRRLGGCWITSMVMAMLARSINIPAALESPSYARHGYVRFPTIDRWAHGDGVIDGLGIIADKLLWRKSDMTGDDDNDFRKATGSKPESSPVYPFRGDASLAKIDLKTQRGIEITKDGRGFKKLKRSNLQVRSVYCGSDQVPCGRILGSDARDYFNSRFSYLGVVVQLREYSFRIVDTKVQLLETVAAWWPLNGERLPWHVREASLRGIHGRVNGTGAVKGVRNCVRDACLKFTGVGDVSIDDHPALRRHDEELSLALWVKASSRNTGVLIGRYITGRNRAVYAINLRSDGRIEFEYPSTILVSGSALRPGKWEHIVVTFDSSKKGGSTNIYLNGTRDASVLEDKSLPMAEYRQNPHTEAWEYHGFPAQIQMGSKGFIGELDEVLLYHGALNKSEVEALHRSYGR